MARSPKAEKAYEAKGARPRRTVGVRLSAEEEAAAAALAKPGESVPAVLRRLLLERIARRSR